jgi:hypothetical protein
MGCGLSMPLLMPVAAPFVVGYALDSMACYLNSWGVMIEVVAVSGGAANTNDALYYQPIDIMNSMLFFFASPDTPENATLQAAANYAAEESNGYLWPGWFRTSVRLVVSSVQQGQLAAGAFWQNHVIYESTGQNGGLKIYAAPWEYSLCAKLHQLHMSAAGEDDMLSAVMYLRLYLCKVYVDSAVESVSSTTIYAWGKAFNKEVTDDLLVRVNYAYCSYYQSWAIAWP